MSAQLASRWRPYPAYKASGVEWLGEIPSHWDAKKVKFLVVAHPDAIKTGPFGSQLLSSEMAEVGEIKVYNQRNVIEKDITGGENYISAEKYDQLRAFSVYPKDILVTTRGTIGRCLILPQDAETSILHPCLMRIQVEPDAMLPEFLEIMIEDSPLVKTQLQYFSDATTIDVVYSTTMRKVAVPVPPIQEQEQILAFLDRETAKIDALIAKMQRLIDLLDERRAALISHVVTKGIEPSVPMRDSGVAWLGDIPRHWDVKRIRHLVGSIDQGVSPQAEATLADNDSWGVLKAGCANGGVFNEKEHKKLPDDFVIDPNIVVKQGDLLVSRASGSPRFVGSTALVTSLNYQLIRQCHI